RLLAREPDPRRRQARGAALGAAPHPELRRLAGRTAMSESARGSGIRAAPGEAAVVALAVALSAVYIAIVCFRPTGTVDLWWTLALTRLAAFVGGGRARDLAWLLPIAVLWANSHASFPLLPGVVLLAAAGSALDAWRSAGFRPAALVASAFSRRTALLG